MKNIKTFNQPESLKDYIFNDLPFDYFTEGKELSSCEEDIIDSWTKKFVKDLLCANSLEMCEAIGTDELTKIERFISLLTQRVAQNKLGIALMIYIIIDKKLYRDVFGCSTKTEYFRCCDKRLHLSLVQIRYYYLIGKTVCDFRCVLFGGSQNETGVTLEFITRNLSKLRYLHQATQKFGITNALKHYKEDNFAAFKGMCESAEKKQIGTRQKIRSTVTETLVQNLMQIPEGKQIISILKKGYFPHIESSCYAEALIGLQHKLENHRVACNEAMKKELGSVGYNPSDPVPFGDDLFKLFNVFDIEERIKAAICSNVFDRWCAVILVYRLWNEDELRSQWRAKCSSFEKYCRDFLGIESGVSLLKVIGTNVVKNYKIMRSIFDMECVSSFYQSYYLEAAITTHAGNIALIKSAANILSVEEFGVFSKDPNYFQKEKNITISKKHIQVASEFLVSLNYERSKGYETVILELLNRDESRYARCYVSQVEQQIDQEKKLTC